MGNGNGNGLGAKGNLIADLVIRLGFPVVVSFLLLWYGSKQIDSMMIEHQQTNTYVRTTLEQTVKAATRAAQDAGRCVEDCTEVVETNTQALMRTTDVLELLEDKLE